MTPQQKEFLQKIFARMTATYSESKMIGAWGGVPENDRDDAFATALAGISGRQMAQALEIMPREYPVWPPNAAELAELCRRFKISDPIHRGLPKLPAPRTRFDPRVKEALQVEIGGALKKDPKAWAKAIVAEAEAGTYRLPIGIQFARHALGIEEYKG